MISNVISIEIKSCLLFFSVSLLLSEQLPSQSSYLLYAFFWRDDFWDQLYSFLDRCLFFLRCTRTLDLVLLSFLWLHFRSWHNLFTKEQICTSPVATMTLDSNFEIRAIVAMKAIVLDTNLNWRGIPIFHSLSSYILCNCLIIIGTMQLNS